MVEHMSWLSFVPWPFLHQNPHVGMTLIVALGLVLAVMRVRLSMSQHQSVVPKKTFSLLNLSEIYVAFIRRFCAETIGHSGGKYVSIAGSLFLFILCCNLLGTLPGFLPPTDNLNTTLAFGAFVFLFYNGVGIREHGVWYLKQFIGPTSSKMFYPLIPLMLVIELMSHLVRPLSLGLRLRGNIYGDHAVHGVFANLIPYVVPIPFLALGIFVAFIQAFVFTLLTLVYISLAESHDH